MAPAVSQFPVPGAKIDPGVAWVDLLWHTQRMKQKLNEQEAQTLLGKDWQLLTSKAPQSNFQVNEGRLRHGAMVLPSQKIESLTIKEHQNIIVDGDLEVTSVLEMHLNAALFVRGDLNAKNICTNGDIYVIGDTKVAGIFYGTQEKFETLLCGDVSIETLLLHCNYQYIERGKRVGVHSAKQRIWDAREGVEELHQAIEALGFHGSLNAESLAKFLRMRAKWSQASKATTRRATTSKASTKPSAKPTKPAKKAPAAKTKTAKKKTK
jgi:hypothetical protein